jgi:hypothetical protein
MATEYTAKVPRYQFWQWTGTNTDELAAICATTGDMGQDVIPVIAEDDSFTVEHTYAGTFTMNVNDFMVSIPYLDGQPQPAADRDHYGWAQQVYDTETNVYRGMSSAEIAAQYDALPE